MAELPELHARSLEVTRAYVAGVAPTQWGDPTPDGVTGQVALRCT